MSEVLVIAGPAGVGKTTAANEVSAQLRQANVAHAVIDTDGLDDVYPVPDDQWKLTEGNLAFIWRGFQDLGTQRLIVNGVYLHRPHELEWICRATGAERLILVRLVATEETLAARVADREIGSAHDAQLSRTMRQAGALDAEASSAATVVNTEGRSIEAIAADILTVLGWR